ncbi:TPA: transposase [Bacillus cereus]|uniref:Mu transposase C-terminal domain-containing protein n=1 Tax=Bacillus TaxID=1386 RepID=UPI001014659B|nr:MULTISPECIES: Mu transposase C-terminal domain-containing protein [Bacillus]GCF74531.1 transposase [Bacillus cereus]MDA1898252.1 Mu transposase C-terminal domain-containing protein [Bacillus cereus group sp. BcHK28]MDA1961440.1 Mu transposase C-terminal domain-containing protein [Bacillus cereus group sp. BcHK10]HDR8456051.1 transposase [Bacillus cereus]HDX9601050.1 transposase [Bacillus cereus]
MFVINDIISIQEADGNKRLERIIWMDEGNVICYTIDMEKKKALPIKWRTSDLQQLHEEQLLSLVDSDPYGFIYQDEGQISEKSKKLRDERWECIKDMVLLEPDIYEANKRGPLIKKEMDNTGKTKRLFYKYMTQYWQRGKIKNALLPDYQNSGGKGNEKEFTVKTGRPRKFRQIIGEGIVITSEIKRIFEVSVKRYYHTAKKNPLATTYNQMLKTYFVADFRYENDVKIPILLEKDKLPTLRQFRFWYEKTYKAEEKLRKRKGNRKYELEDRAVLGTSVGELYGPGTKYQIDATVADVYLVSSFNRNWIIGRPVVYVVIDVFSRMVVGLYVGLEGPSWFGAMMALANTVSNKVLYCKQYGIDITKEDWDCHYLPQTLLADRGELEGYNVERLINAFHMKVENTPPYRADWKGIVEQHFRIINTKVKPFLPGTVDMDVRVRGDRDYRLDATLTLEEFTSVIIHCILHHNNHHWLKNYNQDEMMIQGEVQLIPRELWNWGIKNRSGKLRSYSEDIVKLHLLPTAKARVTYKGIEFKKMRFSSETALKENWFGEARQKSWQIPICYDPRNMSHIYLPSEDGRSYEVATLLDHQKKYSGKTIEEVEYYFAYELLKEQEYSHEKTQKSVDLASNIEHIVQKAKKSLDNEKVEMSNNQKVKGIRGNRSMEKEARRKEEAFLMADAIPIHQEVEKEEKVEEVSSETVVSKMDLLRQKQKEKLKYAINNK